MIKNNLLRNFCILLCSLVLSCLLGELLVYSLFRNKMVLFPRYVTDTTYGSFRIRRNVPNAHYFHKSPDGKWEFDINSKGFRSKREFQYEKPEGTVRILTLGDSFTIGYEVQQEETYSAIIEKYLKSKGFNVEVINAGVSGFSTAEELIFFEREGIKYNPDVVVLGYFENDSKDSVRSDLFRLVDGKIVLNKTEYLPAIKIRNLLNSFFIYRWLSEHSYLHNYLNNVATEYLKEKITRKNLKEVSSMSKNALEDYKKELSIELIKRIYSVAKQNNIYFILLDIPTKELKPSFPALNEMGSGKFCDLYIDSLNILRGYKDLVALYRPNGHDHWSAFSHLMVGKNLGRILEKYFKNRPKYDFDL